MPEPTIIEAARSKPPFPEFLEPSFEELMPRIREFGPVDLPSTPKGQTEKRLAVISIGDTFIEVLEAPSGSACNNCPFAMHDSMPHSPPVCCIPDYLACRPHLRFRIAELKRGVPS